jgi:large subunit ribosomal protein L25
MIQQIDNLKLPAQKREASGSKQSQRLRKAGWLPGIVYDSSGNSLAIQIQRHAFEMFLRGREGQNLILDLDIEGDKTRKVLLKETQRDHIKDHFLHADFLEISMTRKIRIAVPIRLVGEPVGVSQQGGVMEQIVRSVDVECLPGDFVKEFVLDVGALAIGNNLSVRDIKADPKITLLTAPDIVVVSVQLPHFEEEEKPAEEAAAAATAEGAPAAEGEAAAAAAAEPGKGKETAGKGKEAAGKGKEAESKEKGKEPAKEKGKEPKGKEAKDKSK